MEPSLAELRLARIEACAAAKGLPRITPENAALWRQQKPDLGHFKGAAKERKLHAMPMTAC